MPASTTTTTAPSTTTTTTTTAAVDPSSTTPTTDPPPGGRAQQPPGAAALPAGFARADDVDGLGTSGPPAALAFTGTESDKGAVGLAAVFLGLLLVGTSVALRRKADE